MKNRNKIIASVLIALMPILSNGQDKDKAQTNWQNLDLKKDKVFGISTEKAYEELLKGKKSTPVIVAVIDGGVDEEHEDLKDVIWVNSKEIADDKKDNDNNGYIDDINGWNFIGSSKGNIRYDNLEVVRLIRKYQPKYAAVLNSSPLNDQERNEFNLYKKLNTEYMTKLQNARLGFQNLSIIKKTIDTIENKINKPVITANDILAYNSKNDIESKVLKIIKGALKDEPDYAKVRTEIKETYEYYDSQLNYHLNIEFDPRDSIGDIYSNSRERVYGNNDVTGPDASHGTHVGGIIGGVRANNIGIKGVSDNVKIMAIRTVPDGDERDKDVANAIRYAVDNGAKIINMSFGKSYSWDKSIVDSAVSYAALKDVLLVHAAGNDSKDNDLSNNFPTKYYGDTTNANFWNLNKSIEVEQQMLQKAVDARSQQGVAGRPNRPTVDKEEVNAGRFVRPHANNWIEVGASSWTNDENLVAEFSNYGKNTVDVFAPGVKINSTIPGSKYKEEDGTSMASPVVSGLGALLRSYFPHLTAVQVKEIIMNSVSKVEQKVKINDEGNSKKVHLKDISITGGIVNAYNAVLLAQKTPRIPASVVLK